MDLPKLVPKSPIMTWNEDLESPDVTPRDVQQFPFNDPNASRDSYRDRSPLQARENTQNFRSPYETDGRVDQQQRHPNDPSFQRGQPNDRVDQGQQRDSRSGHPGYFEDRGSLRGSQKGSHNYNPSGEYGSLEYDPQGRGYPQGQGHGSLPHSRMQARPQDDSFNRSFDNRQPGDRLDQSRISQRSSGQGHLGLPDDQRSGTSLGQSSTMSQPRSVRDQFSTGSLPRGHKAGSYDPRGPPSSSSLRGQGPQSYNSLPREPRHHDAVSRSGRQGQGQGRPVPTSQSPPGRYGGSPPGRPGGRKDDKNPYMVMSSPQSSMDETRFVIYYGFYTQEN